jgi:hypothetical protein
MLHNLNISFRASLTLALTLRILSIKSCRSWVLPQQIVRPIPTFITTSSLQMALVPLPVEDLEEFLVVKNPSGSQYATYWGRTKVSKVLFLFLPLAFITSSPPTDPPLFSVHIYIHIHAYIARAIQSLFRVLNSRLSRSFLFLLS